VRSLIVVTDSPMMVGAIRAGLSDHQTFRLLGYLTPGKATAERIAESGAEVVLVDEADNPDHTIALIRAVKEADEQITIVFLAIQLGGDHIERAFGAGASSVISKAIHPRALTTFLDESLKDHIVHSPATVSACGEAQTALAEEHLALTSRELGILELVAAGATNHEIAQQLWITRQTVKFHVSNIYRKLGVNNRTGACHYAHVNGILGARAAEAASIAS